MREMWVGICLSVVLKLRDPGNSLISTDVAYSDICTAGFRQARSTRPGWESGALVSEG